jgi:AraC family transcriptional regulator
LIICVQARAGAEFRQRGKSVGYQVFGEFSTSRDVAGFVVGETHYPDGFTSPRHWHDKAQFCVVLAGACVEESRKNTWEYQPLSLEYFPPGESHRLKCKTKIHSFNVQIPTSCLLRLRDHSISAEVPIHCSGGPLTQLMLKMHLEYLQMDEATPLAIEGLVFAMLAEVTRRRNWQGDRKPPRWLEQAREMLQAHFSEPITLSFVSEAVGVHPVHLSREFHKHFGVTLGEYTRRLRIERACVSISTTELPLAKIAVLAGFADQSHFGRTFKHFTGMTPAQYRQSMTRR